MVVTATTENKQAARGRVRRLDPTRDMGAIAQLIDTAFGDDMDRQGRAALRDMRWMSRLSPLVWWWAQADPSFRETYNGFVWEEVEGGQHSLRHTTPHRTVVTHPLWGTCVTCVRGPPLPNRRRLRCRRQP